MWVFLLSNLLLFIKYSEQYPDPYAELARLQQENKDLTSELEDANDNIRYFHKKYLDYMELAGELRNELHNLRNPSPPNPSQ